MVELCDENPMELSLEDRPRDEVEGPLHGARHHHHYHYHQGNYCHNKLLTVVSIMKIIV